MTGAAGTSYVSVLCSWPGDPVFFGFFWVFLHQFRGNVYEARLAPEEELQRGVLHAVEEAVFQVDRQGVNVREINDFIEFVRGGKPPLR